MRGIIHKITAVTAVATFSATNFPSADLLGIPIYTFIAVPCCLVSAAYADIDIEGSEYGSKHPLLAKILTHRGITHTLLPLVALFLVTSTVSAMEVTILSKIICSILGGLFLGYAIHIFCDMLNYKGVPIIWPITKRRFHICCVTTGTWQEWIFLFVWCTLCLAHVICYYGGYIL